MKAVKGVPPSKRLQSSLVWSQWAEAFRSKPIERQRTMGRQVRGGTYRRIRSAYINMPMLIRHAVRLPTFFPGYVPPDWW